MPKSGQKSIVFQCLKRLGLRMTGTFKKKIKQLMTSLNEDSIFQHIWIIQAICTLKAAFCTHWSLAFRRTNNGKYAKQIRIYTIRLYVLLTRSNMKYKRNGKQKLKKIILMLVCVCVWDSVSVPYFAMFVARKARLPLKTDKMQRKISATKKSK